MSYRGTYILGQEVPLALVCVNGSGVPTAPDSAPVMEVFSGSAKVVSRTIPPLERLVITGYFQFRQFLDSTFAAGSYTVTYRWSTGSGSFYGLTEDTFDIVAGGDDDGDVLAMTWYSRPHADFLVQQLTSGKLTYGRNPRA